MSGETKKRLLLSKWRGVTDRAEVARCMERLLEDVDRLNELLGKLGDQDEKIETLEADLKEARDETKSLQDEQDSDAERLQSTLLDVRYWLHDGLVMHKIVSDPRALLRKVEDVLG